jgi:hypothetical protein
MPFYQKEKSVIRMVALTPANFDNVVWYSPIQDNKKPVNTIILSMKRRFEKTGMYAVTRVLQFYDNSTKKLIEEYKK